MKLLKYIGIAGVFSLPLVGCSDFLDADNKSAGGQDGNEYISKDPSALRATTYNDFKSFVGDISMLDQSTDLYSSWRKSDDGSFAQFSITSADGTVESFYKNCFNAVNHANGMIKYAGAESDLGYQGRYLRALAYYYMTQQFGAVPYLTDYVESSARNYPRTPLEELYPAIIEDLKEVYNTSSLPSVDRTGNVSKQAVAALIAKFELAAGWDLDTSLTNAEQGTYSVNATAHFTEAASWAEKAINGQQLTMSFENKWAPSNENNDEVIFCINYQREGYLGDATDGGHSLQNEYCGYYGDVNNSGIKGNGSGGTNQPSRKSTRLWNPGDQRFDGTFMTTIYNAERKDNIAVWGTQGYYAYYNCTDAEKAAMPIAVKFFPYYTTEAEAEAWLTAHSSQCKQYPAGEYGIGTPYAVIYDSENITRFNFKTDGTWEKKSQSFYPQYSGGTDEGTIVKKFDDPASIQSTSKNDYRSIVICHLSDIYLVAAEAYLMANDEGKSLAKIKAVRDRSGAAAINSFGDYNAMVEYTMPATFNLQKIDLILDERARELYAERTRFEDLRRTKQLVRYNVNFSRQTTLDMMMNAAGEIKWYRPIPQAEIDANEGMTDEDQNPGY